jgi:hypothetical protein
MSGTKPSTNASEVIKIGRKRATAPSTADCTRLSPACLRCSAYSTIKIAFFASKPISMISAICT